MSDNQIAGDRIKPDLRPTLQALLDTMIPADEELAAPSAGSDDIVQDVIGNLTGDGAVTVADMLQRLNERAASRFESSNTVDRDRSFAELQATDGHALRVLAGVLLQVYYRNGKVLESLGMESSPPFPRGNEVEQGDWSLLDAVKARKPFYRAV